MSVPFEGILQEHLRDAQVAAAYLDDALEEGGEDEVRMALRDIAEARQGGIDRLAERLRMDADTLGAMLSTTGNLDPANLAKIVRALGLKLSAQTGTGGEQVKRAIGY